MHGEFHVPGGAVAKVKIDQILIGEPGFNSQRLEVGDGLPVETYRDGLLQHPDVGILPHREFHPCSAACREYGAFALGAFGLADDPHAAAELLLNPVMRSRLAGH